MRIGRQARRNAKSLFQACRTDGLLDEALVRQTVTAVLDKKPRGYMQILSQFQRLVKLDIEERTALVESAVEMDETMGKQISKSLQDQHGPGLHISYTVNPKLLGGLRIRVGSDIYDGSVAGRLAAIGSSF